MQEISHIEIYSSLIREKQYFTPCDSRLRVFCFRDFDKEKLQLKVYCSEHKNCKCNIIIIEKQVCIRTAYRKVYKPGRMEVDILVFLLP